MILYCLKITKNARTKNALFWDILLLFWLNLGAVFDAFLVCFGRAVRRALRRDPPDGIGNHKQKFKNTYFLLKCSSFFRVFLARFFVIFCWFWRLFGPHLFGVFWCFFVIFGDFLMVFGVILCLFFCSFLGPFCVIFDVILLSGKLACGGPTPQRGPLAGLLPYEFRGSRGPPFLAERCPARRGRRNARATRFSNFPNKKWNLAR